jgi:hypothetical protein
VEAHQPKSDGRPEPKGPPPAPANLKEKRWGKSEPVSPPAIEGYNPPPPADEPVPEPPAPPAPKHGSGCLLIEQRRLGMAGAFLRAAKRELDLARELAGATNCAEVIAVRLGSGVIAEPGSTTALNQALSRAHQRSAEVYATWAKEAADGAEVT